MFYAIIFLILIGFSFLEITSIDGVYKVILFAVGILILFITAGLRFETGGDWTTYTVFFNQIETLPLVLEGKALIYNRSYMEPAYKLINSLVKTLGGNVQVVFFIIALINSVLLYKALKKYTIYPLVGLLIYYTSMFFFLDMIATRQGVAVLLFFSSLNFVFERKFWRFLAVMVIAFLFHRSSVLLVPLYFIIHRSFSNRAYIIVFFVTLLMFFFQIKWMAGLLTITANIIGGANGAIIKVYLNSSSYGANRSLTVGTLINIILFAIYLSKRKALADYKYFNIFFNLFMVNLIVFFVFYEFIEISNRYRFYFLISNITLLPYLIVVYQEKLSKMLVFASICAFTFLYGRSYFLESPGAIAFNPYQNYVIHVLFDTKSDGAERLKQSDKQYNENNKKE
ncbi:EpsG family protein [Pedobacter mucosus]|uniref:EpsG family protein n=1 Tax=Pedobacter mucosus TaxID=2895286 RepID=UPI001EE3FAB7|nr:EpsG family protein [Pedobacter mucosus]UKT63276.1 EpsG family protein [Pedobacter mucosus]